MSVQVNIPGLTPSVSTPVPSTELPVNDVTLTNPVSSPSSVPVNIPGVTQATKTTPPTPAQPSTAQQMRTSDGRPIKVMVGTPAYGGQCMVSYVLALLNSTRYLSRYGIYIEPCFLTNESLIPRGRNTVCAKFLAKKDFTHLIFIDADINWAPGSILRLLKQDKDLVGALYPKQGYEWGKLTTNKEVMKIMNKAVGENRALTDREQSEIRAKLMSFVVNLEKTETTVQNSLLSIKHLGTGFMLIKRGVLEKMADAMPELKYDDDINILKGTENDHLYAFFNTEVHQLSQKRHFLSEDYLFCKRWKDMGGTIYADINIPLTHTGTHSFAGNFAVCHNFKPRQAGNAPAAQQPVSLAKAAQQPQIKAPPDIEVEIHHPPPQAASVSIESNTADHPTSPAGSASVEPNISVSRVQAPQTTPQATQTLVPGPVPIQSVQQAGVVAPMGARKQALRPEQVGAISVKK